LRKQEKSLRLFLEEIAQKEGKVQNIFIASCYELVTWKKELNNLELRVEKNKINEAPEIREGGEMAYDIE